MSFLRVTREQDRLGNLRWPSPDSLFFSFSVSALSSRLFTDTLLTLMPNDGCHASLIYSFFPVFSILAVRSVFPCSLFFVNAGLSSKSFLLFGWSTFLNDTLRCTCTSFGSTTTHTRAFLPPLYLFREWKFPNVWSGFLFHRLFRLLAGPFFSKPVFLSRVLI